ncbi:hypothetical protein [Campylobacter hyointestinalis]|nr:hypothetical protein [Campylobacter hyointestinalis]
MLFKATPVIKFSSFIWDNICGFDTRNPDIKNHKNKKSDASLAD